MDREVTLTEMMEAREAMALRQQALLEQYALPIISFSLNIAGSIKIGPLIRRSFHEGLSRLSDALRIARMSIRHQEKAERVTGCEAFIVVQGDTREIKRLCIDMEDADALGRLFDMDVLAPNENKMEWERFGLPSRRCPVCGQSWKDCASRCLHTAEELQGAMRRIMLDYFAQKDGVSIAGQAVRALLYEVCTTPKPGLVDRANSGSHKDMNIFTFMDSIASLLPYFHQAVSIGRKTAELLPGETFLRLRRAGLEAERAMFDATKGVNTHKGAVFALGTVCAAAGRVWTPEKSWSSAETILDECAAMSGEAVEKDLAAIRIQTARTKGQQFYLEYGVRGIRGELADGLPAVRKVSLPAFEKAVEAGASLEEAGTAALVRLIAKVTDTNLIARGGLKGQQWAAKAAAELKEPVPSREALEELDQIFIERNLSPGGCADLLAITYFLHFLKEVDK